MGQLTCVWQLSQGLCRNIAGTLLLWLTWGPHGPKPEAPAAELGGWGEPYPVDETRASFEMSAISKASPSCWTLSSLEKGSFPLDCRQLGAVVYLAIQSYPRWTAGEDSPSELPSQTWGPVTSSHFSPPDAKHLLTHPALCAAVGPRLSCFWGAPPGLDEFWGQKGGRQATPLPWRGCRTWWTEPKPSLGLFTSLPGRQLFLGWLPRMHYPFPTIAVPC